MQQEQKEKKKLVIGAQTPVLRSLMFRDDDPEPLGSDVSFLARHEGKKTSLICEAPHLYKQVGKGQSTPSDAPLGGGLRAAVLGRGGCPDTEDVGALELLGGGLGEEGLGLDSGGGEKSGFVLRM
jgi:hypothetical protein